MGTSYSTWFQHFHKVVSVAKAMSQLWKFFSRARRGIYTNETVAEEGRAEQCEWFLITKANIPRDGQQFPGSPQPYRA
ncbi:hypothetical protein GFL58_29505 [Rhizobium leguminosarum bv. viciae]|nr:hypothetical protein [Rhizobium leguminosarum bv. viciae]